MRARPPKRCSPCWRKAETSWHGRTRQKPSGPSASTSVFDVTGGLVPPHTSMTSLADLDLATATLTPFGEGKLEFRIASRHRL
jgi:hypothetical protein